MAARVTGDTSDDTHLADDSKRGENTAGCSGYAPPVQEECRMTGGTSVDAHLAGDGGAAAPKAAPDWKPGYFRAIARKRAMCVFDDAGDGSAGRTVEQTGNEDEDPGETCSRLCSGVPPPAASRSVSSTALINEDPWMCSGVPPPAASRGVSSSASDSEEEWRRQHPEPFEGAKDAAEKLRRIKHERNYQRHRSASTLCKHLNRRGGCRHGCTLTKTYCHKYQRGQCHRGLNCKYAHS